MHHRRTTISLLLLTALYALCVLCVSCPSAVAQEWKRVEIPPPADVSPDYWLEVYFLPSNQQYGWIVGMNRRTLFTRDGGKTWQRSSAPGRTRRAGDPASIVSGEDRLEGIFFADSLVGYCSGSAGVFKSTDGGKTWADVRDSVLMPEGVTWGCYALSRDTAFVVGGGCGNSIGFANPQHFYRTTDGGRTWSDFRGDAINSGVTDVVFEADHRTGYASSSGLIWRTTDAGATWKIFTTTGAPNSDVVNVWQEDLQRKGRSFLVPIAGTSCGGGGNAGGARFSTDNGATWSEFQTGKSAFGAFLLNDSTGWVVGDDASVIYTADGGRSWEYKNCGIPDDVNIDDLWFVNDTTGFAVGGKFTVGMDSPERRNVYRFVPPSERLYKLQTPQTLFCDGDSLVLTAPNDFLTYNWSNGGTTRSIVIRTSDRYSVTGCKQYSDTVSIRFAPRPEARILLSRTGRLCEGDSVTLSSVALDPRYRYEWLNGTNIVSAADRITVGRSGTYTLRVTNDNACSVSSVASITVFPRPNTTLRALRALQFCVNDSTVLEAPAGFREYRWSDGTRDSIARTQRITVRLSGRYSVRLTDENGCVWQSNIIDATRYNFTKQLFITSELTNGVFTIDTTTVTGIRCVPMRLLNRDTVRTVVISAVNLARNVEFSVPLSQFPLVVPPNSERSLTICYNASQAQMQRDTLYVADSCGATPVTLVSVGAANLLEGTSRCDASLLIRSIGTLPLTTLRASLPAPNPASTEVSLYIEHLESLSTALSPPSTTQVAERCLIYNLMGVVVAQAAYQSVGTRSEGDVIYQQGQFVADTRLLASGTYLVVVQGKQGTMTFPLVIER